MKRFLLLLVGVVLIACNAPTPLITPTVAPSFTPSIAPSPMASIAAPTNEPIRQPDRPAVDSALLPAVEQTLDLGRAMFANYYLPVPLALDAQTDRLYASLSPSRTIVLDANTLTSIDEIPLGGALSVNPSAQHLYIGVPGRVDQQPDGTTMITPAELKLFDTTSLAPLHSLIPNAQSTVPPQAFIDSSNSRVYIVQDGITIADATTLDVQGTLSGTFPIPDAAGPNYSAFNAAIDPQRQRLFVSLYNGLAGSNSGHVLAIYDLASGQVVHRDDERSVSDFGVDETTGNVFSPRSNMGVNAIVKYDSQGKVLKRLDGLSGLAQVDAAHDRVYLFERGEAGRIVTFDRDLNLLGVSTYPISGAGTQFAIVDPERDRLYVLQGDGKLIVLKGHAKSIRLPPLSTPDRHAVFSIFPSASEPNSVYALFAFDEYVRQGSLFHTRDNGVTWNVVNSWPLYSATSASDALFAAIYQLGPAGLGIWRSADDGQTWQPASLGLTDLAINQIAVSPDFARDGTLFALSKRGVFRSADRGVTWVSLSDRYAPLLQDLSVNFNTIALSPNFAQDNMLLIGHTSGLWRSTDRGETWSKIEGGPAANRLAYVPDGAIVLALDYDGVHRSDDGGQTWRLFNEGLDPGNSLISEVQITDREAVILVTRFDQPGMLYRLPGNATTWQPISIDADVSAFALAADGVLYIGTRDGSVQRKE